MNNQTQNHDSPNTPSRLPLGLIFLLGIIALNAVTIALNSVFPGNLNGIGAWMLVEIGIVVVAGGFAYDLAKERRAGRSRWRYSLIYPAIWFGLGLAVYFFHRAFLA